MRDLGFGFPKEESLPLGIYLRLFAQIGGAVTELKLPGALQEKDNDPRAEGFTLSRINFVQIEVLWVLKE